MFVEHRRFEIVVPTNTKCSKLYKCIAIQIVFDSINLPFEAEPLDRRSLCVCSRSIVHWRCLGLKYVKYAKRSSIKYRVCFLTLSIVGAYQRRTRRG